MSDDDSKDTQVLAKEEAGSFDMEGTEEMDRAALLARLQADAASRASNTRDSGELVPTRDTHQQAAVSEKTRVEGPRPGAAPDPTQAYIVPDSLLRKTRDTQVETVEVPMESLPRHADPEVDDSPTTTFSMKNYIEFDGVVDDQGNIKLPESARRGKFRHGARVKVVVRLDED